MSNADTAALVIAFACCLLIVVRIGDDRALAMVGALCLAFVLLGITL